MTMPDESTRPLLINVHIFSDYNDDTIVVQGSSEEASGVMLNGYISLKARKPVIVKNLKLRLEGKAVFDIPVQKNYGKVTETGIIRFERKVYRHIWPNFNIKESLELLARQDVIHEESHKHNAVQNEQNSAHQFNVDRLVGYTQDGDYVLKEGYYRFPFSGVLPGSLIESVEGLPRAKVSYTLQATVTDARDLRSSFKCQKKLFIVRVPLMACINFNDTFTRTKIWPHKLKSQISLCSKHIEVGGQFYVNFKLSPLHKGIHIESIKLELHEIYQYMGNNTPVVKKQRTIRSWNLINLVAGMNKRLPLLADGYSDLDCDSVLSIPKGRDKCVQNCDIMEKLKVRHNLMIVVSLQDIQGERHSESFLLPVVLYISPIAENYDFRSRDWPRTPEEDSLLIPTNSIAHSNLFGCYESVKDYYNPNYCPKMSDELANRLSPPPYEMHKHDSPISHNDSFLIPYSPGVIPKIGSVLTSNLDSNGQRKTILRSAASLINLFGITRRQSVPNLKVTERSASPCIADLAGQGICNKIKYSYPTKSNAHKSRTRSQLSKLNLSYSNDIYSKNKN